MALAVALVIAAPRGTETALTVVIDGIANKVARLIFMRHHQYRLPGFAGHRSSAISTSAASSADVTIAFA